MLFGSVDLVYIIIVLGVGVDVVCYDFLEVWCFLLFGFVYVDGNYSNVCDVGDVLIVNVIFELFDVIGIVVVICIIGNDGSYSFLGLDLQIYMLCEVLLDGSYCNCLSVINFGLIGGVVCVSCSVVIGVGGDVVSIDCIVGIDLFNGDDGIVFNFGEDVVIVIFGYVYLDCNGNGDFDVGDVGDCGLQFNGGLQDVIIILIGVGLDGVYGIVDDLLLVSVQIDVQGCYIFDILVVGQYYCIIEMQLQGYVNVMENLGNWIDIVMLLLIGFSGNDFGEKFGFLVGFVYEDFFNVVVGNNNGVCDSGENLIVNVIVIFIGIDVFGNLVSLIVIIDVMGVYCFNDLLLVQVGIGYMLIEIQLVVYLDGKYIVGMVIMLGSIVVFNVIFGIGIDVGQDVIGYLFGELVNVFISGMVYLDCNDDGQNNVGDVGIFGVQVVIVGVGLDGVFGIGDDISEILLINVDGYYSYFGVVVGQDYCIIEIQLIGLVEGCQIFGNVINIVNLLVVGLIGNDFGECVGSLFGIVYLDCNNNGVQDVGELGLFNVQVQLLVGMVDVLGQLFVVIIIDVDGYYCFVDLLVGIYMVIQQVVQLVFNGVVMINGIICVGIIDGILVGIVIFVVSVFSVISVIMLLVGKVLFVNNFGEVLVVFVFGMVFFDVDNNGVQQGVVEIGIEGVIIELIGIDDIGVSVQCIVQIDVDGCFVFVDLCLGIYMLVELQQFIGISNGIIIVGIIDGVSSGIVMLVIMVFSWIGMIDLFMLGSVLVDNLFGEILFNSGISGKVWIDCNNDGVVDLGEIGLVNVVIILIGIDLVGNLISCDIVIDVDGNYSFGDLLLGIYIVIELEQLIGICDGCIVVGSIGGMVIVLGMMLLIIIGLVLGVNQQLVQNNFGEILIGSIVGCVYNDSNDNGLVDLGEGGIVNVIVVLIGIDDLGQLVLIMLIIDVDGCYCFDGLCLGIYMVIELIQLLQIFNGIICVGIVGGVVIGVVSGCEIVLLIICQIVLLLGGDLLDNNFGEIGDLLDMLVSKLVVSLCFIVNNIVVYIF